MTKDIMIFIAIFLAISSAALLVRKLTLSMMGRWARKTETKVDNIILESTRHPSIYWSIAIGLYVAIGSSSFPPKFVDYSLKTIHILIVLSVTLALANLISRLIQYAIESRELPLPATGLSRTIIKAVGLTIGILIILSSLGISITPIITALGVGGLAVALALQDTLSNLFAGIHILVERPIRIGDYIKLSSGEEGYVMDIGWRTTRIRMLANNVIIIPNNKLSQSIITNYYYPEKRMSLLIPIGVSYDSDPDRVEKILVQEAQKAAGEIAGLLKEPPPFVRFIPGFGDSSLNFTLICQVAEYVDQYIVQHELRKRILKRFKEEGIEIPFPIRTVYLKQTKEQI
ncbi:MAG: mechanosensitive ion channel family protein [Deltaproteobacteria bacterium]|nr:mechanosensitive ion channel family protein [Deltaproteobacteria bacterium]